MPSQDRQARLYRMDTISKGIKSVDLPIRLSYKRGKELTDRVLVAR
jgi:hypothetical protein